MRFDLKLIHADEPPLIEGGELDLPADLAAVAQQLGDDASRLAAKYPAGGLKTEFAPRHGVRQYASYVVAGTAVAALLVALLTWQSLPEQPAAKTAAAMAAPIAVPNIAPSLSTTPAVDRPRGENVSLADLSAPELEGLFDLLDREPGLAREVSF